jgi:Zn finger protein HypA/HybF involved in hydrogenase expression
MHELSIVAGLIGQVQQELRRAGAHGRVKRLDVVIGRLSGVHCDSIRFAFELLSPGTIVEKAGLEISEPRQARAADNVARAGRLKNSSCHARPAGALISRSRMGAS